MDHLSAVYADIVSDMLYRIPAGKSCKGFVFIVFVPVLASEQVGDLLVFPCRIILVMEACVQFPVFIERVCARNYGPGLGVRIIGEVTAEKVRMVQDADAIYREEIAKAGLDRKISQYFAALTNMRSVGVMGDFRTYDYAVALRAVVTDDFMTAEAADIPFDVLQRVMNRIVNEVKGINRVMYDISSKPPGTIEFE